MGEQPAKATKYRARAAEMRAEAQVMKAPEAKKAMLAIAENYETLASVIERRTRE